MGISGKIQIIQETNKAFKSLYLFKICILLISLHLILFYANFRGIA